MCESVETYAEKYGKKMADAAARNANVNAVNKLMVPIEEIKDDFEYDSVEVLIERAKGKYPSGMNKEGIVIRPLEPVYSKTIEGPLSMKVLNNDYLLKE